MGHALLEKATISPADSRQSNIRTADATREPWELGFQFCPPSPQLVGLQTSISNANAFTVHHLNIDHQFLSWSYAGGSPRDLPSGSSD